MKEARQAQNRRAWQKKRRLQLLDRQPPTVPECIQDEAEKDIPRIVHPSIYNQFLEGRESLGLDEVDVEEEDFEEMMKESPESNTITSAPGFSGFWLKLSAALHGTSARQYLQYCDELISRANQLAEGHLIAGLDFRYHELLIEFKRRVIAIQKLSERGDEGAVAIATQNNYWVAKQIVYTAQDIVALREGCSKLVSMVTERRWTVGRKRCEYVGEVK